LNIDYDEMFSRSESQADQFLAAKPFPHIAIDNFFDAESYAFIRDTFPSPDSEIWKKPSNEHTKNKMVTKQGANGLKETSYTLQAKEVFRELGSASFLQYLEKMSGITGLIADPYLAEGGFHCSGNGGYLDAHADFSHHDHLGLERRLNLIMYLNDDWKPEYGGALSLFDEDLNPATSVEPIGNRCVIFKTSETSFHGHPVPMVLPDNIYRRSIALYYYSMPTQRQKSRIIFPMDPDFVHTQSKE